MDKQWNRALALAVALAGLVTRNIGRIHPAATPSAGPAAVRCRAAGQLGCHADLLRCADSLSPCPGTRSALRLRRFDLVPKGSLQTRDEAFPFALFRGYPALSTLLCTKQAPMPIGMDKQWNRALALAVALAGLVTRNIGRIHPAATPSGQRGSWAAMLICFDAPTVCLHALAPGLLFACDVSTWSQKVSALSIVTTTQDSAQVPQGPESATTLRRDTTDADGEQPRSSMRPSGHSAPRTPPVTDSAKHNRRISVPSPGAPGLPVGAAVAATEDEGASVVSPGRVHEPEESNSLKWMSTKEPGAKAKKRDDEDSSAGPSHVQLLSPPGGSASARKRKLKSAAAPAHDTGTGKSSGSRTELCGILSGLLGRFRLKSISLGEVDDISSWVNPDESCDWRLSSLSQLHILGKGSFGVVYLVRHKATKELAALKCIEKHHREQAKEARRVEAERVAWQAVSHHPFVATLKAYYETTRAWCFVMEYVSRGTLSQIIRRSGPLTETKAKLVSAQLAHALNFVHGAGYLHRDISSSNVLLDDRGNARLIDFGLCQDPSMRLGCRTGGGFTEMMQHPFFSNVDWRALIDSPGVQSAGLTFASLTSPRY
ncbi:putative serine/threonine protein kinase [Ixodes scapularis]